MSGSNVMVNLEVKELPCLHLGKRKGWREIGREGGRRKKRKKEGGRR